MISEVNEIKEVASFKVKLAVRHHRVVVESRVKLLASLSKAKLIHVVYQTQRQRPNETEQQQGRPNVSPNERFLQLTLPSYPRTIPAQFFLFIYFLTMIAPRQVLNTTRLGLSRRLPQSEGAQT